MLKSIVMKNKILIFPNHHLNTFIFALYHQIADILTLSCYVLYTYCTVLSQGISDGPFLRGRAVPNIYTG